MFSRLATVVSEILFGRAEHHLMPEPPERDAADLHVKVATAIQSGDGPGARAWMEEILEDTSRALQRAAMDGPAVPARERRS